MTTYFAHHLRKLLPVLALIAATGCRDEAGMAPSPPRFDWPDEFAYRVDFVASEQYEGRVVRQYADSRTLRFMIRDDESYLLVPDSVFKTRNDPGAPLVTRPYVPEDTLSWYLRLGNLGQFTGVMAACDPALPACRAVPRSTLAADLRRIIPRLSEWPVPAGGSWADTLNLVDEAGDTRGALTTVYLVGGDTTIGGEAYWMVGWRAELRTYRTGSGAAPVAQPPSREDGMTFVEKRRLLPVFATWAGVRVVAGDSGPPLATGFRGRAWLAGSPFDSIAGRQ
jgi:hypothetical protein